LGFDRETYKYRYEMTTTIYLAPAAATRGGAPRRSRRCGPRTAGSACSRVRWFCSGYVPQDGEVEVGLEPFEVDKLLEQSA
jgi:hypothetical protein